MPEKGHCAVCGFKTGCFCLSSPCRHDICPICLHKKTDLEVCSQCKGNVESLSCPGENLGCTVSAAPESWKDHVSKCLFIPVKCPFGRKARILKKSLWSHMKNSPLRIATCQHCGEAVYQIEVVGHEESCPNALLSCPYCLQEGIKMKQQMKVARRHRGPVVHRSMDTSSATTDEEMDEHLVLKTHAVCFETLTEKLENVKSELPICGTK